MISINVNNSKKNINKNTSLTQLLEEIQHSANGIAIAVNETVVVKTNWSTTLLQDNDTVLIIKATQGG